MVAAMSKAADPRVAWVLTGSGHYLKECMEIVKGLSGVDLFLSEAAGEVLKMYGYDLAKLKESMKVFRDNTASSVPVTFLYGGDYHTLGVGTARFKTRGTQGPRASPTPSQNNFQHARKKPL